jgi:hypothetical protein
MLKNYIFLKIMLVLACTGIFAQDELQADKIFEKVDNSIVVILAYDGNGNVFQGSGVVIDNKGTIVTNYHVCKDANRIEVKHYSKEIKNIEMLQHDEVKDILFLKMSDNTFTPITPGSSNSLKTGQRVYAVGSPEGYENSISEGIISGFRNDENNVKLIQMTAPITEGSSGGAVLNSKGELIGLSISGQHEGNLYFALPVDDVYALLGNTPVITETVDPTEYYKIGTQANEDKNYKDAEVYFSKYLDKFSNDLSAYYNRGYARFKLKEYKSAISDFSLVLENTGTSDSYFYRGNCYYSLKDYKKAYADYTKALEQEPDGFDILYNRGYASFRMKDYQNAINDWKKTLELNPDYQSELNPKIKIAEEELRPGLK